MIMKTLSNNLHEGFRYETPCIHAIEMMAGEILCASDWNEGSISDTDENWNILETI